MRDDAPSATANLVARNLLLVAGTNRLTQLVPREAALWSGWLVADFSPQGHVFIRRSRKRWFQSLQRFLERLTIPGLALHQALRKRHIERAVRESLAAGYSQLVVLGGGLDSLAVRLHTEFAEANFIEIDHPATQRIKRSTLMRRRPAGPNLSLLPVDLSKESLEESLNSSPSYDQSRRTVFLSEGVLMYLDGRAVDHVFRFIRRQSSAPARFIFTFMETDEKGRACFRRSTWLVRLWLSLRKEPFRWGLRESEIAGFLNERGFVLREMATSATFREIYLRQYGLEDATLAEGENVCVADSAG
jgi:methyltransferase (TIGR00027 family)